MALEPCPCGAGEPYLNCCGPLHLRSAVAQTAEQLMRSRYSAFVKGEDEYLLATWHPRTRPDRVETGGIDWLGLEIIDVVDGQPWQEEGVVEFIARHHDGELRERSSFAKRGGRWFYLDALD